MRVLLIHRHKTVMLMAYQSKAGHWRSFDGIRLPNQKR